MDESTRDHGASAVDELLHFGVKGMKWGVRKMEAGLDRKNIPDSPFTVGQKISDLPHQTITKTDILIDNDARENVRNGAPLSKSALKSLAEGPPRVLATDKNGRVISGDDINYPTKTKGYDPLVGKPSGYDVKSAKKGRRRDTMRTLGLVGLVGAAAAAEFLRQSDEDETVLMSDEEAADAVLAHFGVKGMKWGVRKDGSRGAVRRTATKANVALNAGAKVIQEGEKKLIFLPQAARNRAAAKTQARVLGEAAAINRSAQFKGKDLKGNTRLKNAYFKKVEEAAKTVYAEELNISRVQAWGEFLGVETSTATNQMRISAAVDRIKHADDDDREILLEMNFETDELGHIVGVNVPEKYLKHEEGEGEDVLIHYGVKGMKWGVTRTKAQIEAASEDAVKTQVLKSRAKTSGTNALSNTELKTAIERMNLETQYARLAEQTTTKSKGKRVAEALFGDLVKDVVRPEATRVGKAALQLKVEKGLRERGQGDLADRIKPKKK